MTRTRGARAPFASALALATSFALALAGAPALAQPAGPAPAPAPDDKERARKLADEATQAYKLGRFQEALESYTKAYELVPAPGLLFNIAQCYRGLKNHERAIFHYEGYLREKPNAPNRDIVEELLAEERELLAAERAAKAAEAERLRREAEAARARAEAEQLRLEEQRRRREEERRRAAALTGGPVIGEGALAGGAAANRDDDGSIFRRWWFWTAVGAVAVAGAGTALYLNSQRDTVLPSGTLGNLDGRGMR